MHLIKEMGGKAKHLLCETGFGQPCAPSHTDSAPDNTNMQ